MVMLGRMLFFLVVFCAISVVVGTTDHRGYEAFRDFGCLVTMCFAAATLYPLMHETRQEKRNGKGDER